MTWKKLGARLICPKNRAGCYIFCPEVFKKDIKDTSLVGSPATIRQRIAAFEALGIQQIIMDLPSATDLTVLYRFAQEFMVV